MNLETHTVPELKAMAKAQGLTGYSKLTKAELIERLERAQGKALWAAPKSAAVKEFAKENGLEVIDVPMTLVDSEDMLGVPVTGGTDFTVARVVDVPESEDTAVLASGSCPPEEQYRAVEPRFSHVEIASPKSSDELWDEAQGITEEVLEQPKGSMRVMNRAQRRRAAALLRKKMRKVA